MTNATDKFELKTQGNILLWRNKSLSVSESEAIIHADKIKELIQTGNINIIIVDNREVGNAIWPMEVNPIWQELMGFMIKYVNKCATFCSSATIKMQLNRASRNAGTIGKVMAFTDEAELLAFVGIEELPN